MLAIADPCPSCGGFTIRPSRLRTQDFAALLRLLRPLRCRNCGDRYYVRMFGREEIFDTPDKELVVRIRVKHPPRLLRALLTWAADPPSHSD